MPNLQKWDHLEEVVVGPTVSKRIVAGIGATVVRLNIKADTQAPRHSHGFEQFVQVVSGGGVLETDEGTVRFSAGDLFHFKPDAWHAAHFDEDTILVETNLMANAPRQD